MARPKYLLLGRVKKAHGLKGELSIISFAESPLVFKKLKRVFVEFKGEYYEYELENAREHTKFVLLKLKEISNRTEAEKFKGLEIYVAREDLEIEEDELFQADLIGCKVFLIDGSFLGKIKDIYNYGEQEIWSIVAQNKKEVLFPAVDEFVEEVDIENERIVINPPPGLLEIYLS